MAAATGADGQPARGSRQIDEAEAAVVRGIFRDYAHARSPRRIAHELNAAGVPGPSGLAWGPSTLNGNRARGSGILNNELYIGRLVWNRPRYLKDPDTGNRVSRLNPPEAWVTQEVPALRIVPQELWDQVKARQRTVVKDTRPDRRAKADRPVWDRRRPRYLFSGLVRCGSCGGRYSKISANLFGCAAARNKGPTACTNRLNIRRDVLEATVLDGLKGHLMDPDLFQEFCAEFTRETNRRRAQAEAEGSRLRTELAGVERRIARLVGALADGAAVRSVRDVLLRQEALRETLEGRIQAAPEPNKPRLHPNLAVLYRERVARLHEALANEATWAEAAALIRSLVEAIVLTPDGDRLTVELRGELAGILALGQDMPKPGAERAAGLGEQIKVVAGAGNHRHLTLPAVAI